VPVPRGLLADKPRGLTMFQASVPPAVHALVALGGVLAKGAAHAEAEGTDPALLLQARLSPDMFPLVKQVQIACDMVKNGCARLAQLEPPAFPDTETSFAELQDRIERTLGYLAGLSPAAITGSEAREIVLTVRGKPLRFEGAHYLFGFVLPNLHFHTAIAYAILRTHGVALDKRDYLGALPE